MSAPSHHTPPTLWFSTDAPHVIRPPRSVRAAFAWLGAAAALTVTGCVLLLATRAHLTAFDGATAWMATPIDRLDLSSLTDPLRTFTDSVTVIAVVLGVSASFLCLFVGTYLGDGSGRARTAVTCIIAVFAAFVIVTQLPMAVNPATAPVAVPCLVAVVPWLMSLRCLYRPDARAYFRAVRWARMPSVAGPTARR